MSSFELETYLPTIGEQLHSKLTSIFVGREQELKKLHHFLTKTREGHGSFVIIGGETGTGKSALVNQFIFDSEKTGAITIEESFTPENRYEPYSPFFRIVEKLGKSIADKNNLLEEWQNLGKNSEDSGNGKSKRNWDIESLYSLQKQSGLIQQKLVSSLVSFAKENVIVISLENIYLAPQTSWQFIHYLSKSIIENKLLVLITLRQDGKERIQEKIPVYASILQRMNRECLFDKLEMKRFDQKHIRQFLNKTFKYSDFSNNFIPLLHEVSDGLPVNLLNCLESIYEKGIIYEQNRVWFNKDNISKENLIKLIFNDDKIKSSLDLLHGLSEYQIKLLKYTALLTEPFDNVLLSKIISLSRVEIAKELVKLKEQKILIDVTNDKYQFRNSILSSAIIKQIPNEELSKMHLLIAEAIKQTEETLSCEKIYALAYHYYKTDQDQLTFQYLRKSFDSAISNFAFTEAKDFFEKAFEIFNKNKIKLDNSEILYLTLKMIWLDRVLGLYKDSIKYANFAYELCSESHDDDLKNQILIQKGLTFFRLNDWTNAKDCFLKCLNAEEPHDLFIQAMANFGLGNVCLELAEYKKSKEYYNKSINLAITLDEKSLQGTLYNNLGIIENILGNRMQSISFYSQSIPVFEKLGDNFGIARVYHNIGMTYADENSWQKANEFYGKSLSVSDVMGLLPLKSVTFLNRALALTQLNNLSEAREYNFKAYRILKRLDDELGIAEYHKIQGIIEREEHIWIDAEENFDLALKKFKSLKNKLGVAETMLEKGNLDLKRKNQENGTYWLTEAKDEFQKLGILEKVKMIDEKLKENKSKFSSKIQVNNCQEVVND